jgi:hypothetical protein
LRPDDEDDDAPARERAEFRARNLGDAFETACEKCGELIQMILTRQGWKACQLEASDLDIAPPRRPVTGVTEGGGILSGLQGDSGTWREVYALHWYACQKWETWQTKEWDAEVAAFKARYGHTWGWEHKPGRKEK